MTFLTSAEIAATIDELIAKLEAAAEGSMGLSREIARAVGWVNRGNSRKGEWFHPSDVRDGEPVLDSLHGTDVHREPPDFSRSLDAALTLVPEGMPWEIFFMAHCGKHKHQYVASLYPEGKTDRQINGGSNSPALALCIAALKVRLVSLRPTAIADHNVHEQDNANGQ